jgi:ubiquinone/menaquinone biosynthesis C-methylase UbiE
VRLGDVSRNYDRAAAWYDRATDLVFGTLLHVERFRARTIELLGELDGATVLDVGCGTGRNLPLLVPRVGPRGRVVALDYSEGMLAQARRRVARHHFENVELVRADAVQLAGAPESIDAILSVWCLGIVYDLEGALRRMLDVLRPGGRIAIMDFQRVRPPRGALHWLYPVYRVLLERSRIDAAEDLDDARLQERWRRGRRVLAERLEDLHEESYLQGGGLILAGRRSP